jgi:hypothetical protein
VDADGIAYSYIVEIRMPVSEFDVLEGHVYRLLRTGWQDDYVDVWPEKKGTVLFAAAAAAVNTTSPSEAMAEARRTALATLALCPPGSVIGQVQVADHNDNAGENTMFWSPDDPPEHNTGATS